LGIILDVVAPVFAVIALGYGAARLRLLDEAGFRGINLFVFSLAAPALLFAGGTSGGGALAGAAGAAALAFLIGSTALYAACLWLGRAALGLPLGEAGVFALNCAFGNTVMMGIPIIAAGFGQAGLAVLLGILAIHSLVLLGLATVVAEIGLHAHAPWRRMLRPTLAGVMRNPIVMSVVAALAWSALGLPVPGMARRTLELLGAAAPSAALFVLGGSLAGFGLAEAWRETVLTVVIKLFAMPLLLWGVAALLGLGPLETAVVVVVGAMPTGANAFMLARRYATGADRSGAAVLISTALSVLTIGGLLVLFQAG
jgi:predicted permease